MTQQQVHHVVAVVLITYPRIPRRVFDLTTATTTGRSTTRVHLLILQLTSSDLDIHLIKVIHMTLLIGLDLEVFIHVINNSVIVVVVIRVGIKRVDANIHLGEITPASIWHDVISMISQHCDVIIVTCCYCCCYHMMMMMTTVTLGR